jgi:hypothetical protein
VHHQGNSQSPNRALIEILENFREVYQRNNAGKAHRRKITEIREENFSDYIYIY